MTTKTLWWRLKTTTSSKSQSKRTTKPWPRMSARALSEPWYTPMSAMAAKSPSQASKSFRRRWLTCKTKWNSTESKVRWSSRGNSRLCLIRAPKSFLMKRTMTLSIHCKLLLSILAIWCHKRKQKNRQEGLWARTSPKMSFPHLRKYHSKERRQRMTTTKMTHLSAMKRKRLCRPSTRLPNRNSVERTTLREMSLSEKSDRVPTSPIALLRWQSLKKRFSSNLKLGLHRLKNSP